MPNIDKITLKGTDYTIVDSTVPTWAKESSKPTYTAAEVGALPDSTAIPNKTSDLTNDSGFVTGSKIYCGTCTTKATDYIKVVTTEEFPINSGKPLTGTVIAVKFSYTDESSSSSLVYLNVNSTGNIRIMYDSGNFASGKKFRFTGIAGGVYFIYMFDGSYWRWITNTHTSNTLLGFGLANQTNTSDSTSINATLENYCKTTNGIVCVKFNRDVLANSVLYINNQEGGHIKYRGSNITDNIIKAGDTVTFIYNYPSGFHVLSIDSCYTKTEIDAKIGDIETLLTSI